MMEWETIHLAVHRQLEWVEQRTWLIAAGVCLACSIGTGWAVHTNQLGLAFLVSCLTGGSFYFMSDITRLAKRRFLRSLLPADLPPDLETKLVAALQPIGKWQYSFAIHVLDPGQCFLLEYDGRWCPQLYLSRWMLERWPVEHLKLLVLHIRQRLRNERSWYPLPGDRISNAGVMLGVFGPLALINEPHWPGWYLVAATAVLLAVRWHVTWWLRSEERGAAAMADLLAKALLAADPDEQAVYVQAVAMYEYHRHPPVLRRNRLLQRLSFVCHDQFSANAWLVEYEIFLAADTVPAPLPARTG